MDPLIYGAVMAVVLVVMAGLHLPLSLALAAIGVGGGWLYLAVIAPDAVGPVTAIADLAAMLGGVASDLAVRPAVLAIPIFITLGNLALVAGVATRLYDAAAVWLRRVPGGVAIATLLGTGGFAAISGSSVACAATMGRICIPEMLRLRYDPRLAGAVVAVGGTLGALIPPSILFILFGLLTGDAIPALFLAGLIPGLLSLLVMVGVVITWLQGDPSSAPRIARAAPGAPTLRDAAWAIWPLAVIFPGLMIGAATGLAGLLVAGAGAILLVTMIGLRAGRLTGGVLGRALIDSALQSLNVLAIVIAALVFHKMLGLTTLPAQLALWVQLWDWSAYSVLAAIVIVCLLLGMFLDPAAILVVVLPFAVPLVQGYGLNLIWFAVLLVKLLEIALITPPVGLNVFVIANVSRDLGVERVFQGVVRFLIADLLVVLVLILFPALATVLPGLFWP